jgi:hypothetical protein
LRALGVTTAGTPGWDRPVQLFLGILLGVVAVSRGRWLAVPLVVLAVRLLFDPGTYPYYTAGLVLASVLVDLGWRQTRWPWLSIMVVLGLYAVRSLGPLTPTNAVLGWLRAATLLGVLAVALGPDLRKEAQRLGGSRSPSPRAKPAGPRRGSCQHSGPANRAFYAAGIAPYRDRPKHCRRRPLRPRGRQSHPAVGRPGHRQCRNPERFSITQDAKILTSPTQPGSTNQLPIPRPNPPRQNNDHGCIRG